MDVVKSSKKLQFTLAACTAGVAGSQAGAAIIYNAVDLTVSSAGPRTSGTIMLPAIGINSDDSRGGATFTPTTNNGVRVTKPSVNGVSITFGADGSYPSGGPIDTLVTAFSAGTPVAYTSSASPYAVLISNPLLMISEDNAYGNFPVEAGVKYAAINYTSSQNAPANNYNGWIEYQTLSTGTTVSARITGVAFESTPNIPIVTGDRGSVNTWVPTTSGSFAAGSNWSTGSAPAGAGSSILFGGTISAPSTVTLANNTTVGVLNINSPVGYTIAGGGSTLTMDGGTAPATIRVAAGSHTISAPITLGSNTHISLEVGSKLTTTTIDGAKTLTVTGGGVLSVPTRLTATTLTILSNSLVDIGRGGAVLTGATEAAVRTLVTNWRNTGFGLGSTAGDPLTTLGVITNTNGRGGSLYTSFDGFSPASNAILVKYTYIGDTDLNGRVDASDVANLLAGMNGKLTGWLNGDLNYDGKVDTTDYGLLMTSLSGQGNPYGDPGGATVGSAVPEPTSLSLLAVGAVGLAAYRKRSPAA